jgi:malonyl CoA-acyl carrier protein transacylase
MPLTIQSFGMENEMTDKEVLGIALNQLIDLAIRDIRKKMTDKSEYLAGHSQGLADAISIIATLKGD